MRQAQPHESRRTIDALGHRTNYHDVGSGRPLVLLHGSGAGVSAWANWNGVLSDLAQSFRVIAPDIAGFGHTELKTETRYDIKLWVAHFIGILDALDLDHVSIVGNSFGGALALATALSHPHRVNRLVLLGTPCGEFPMTDGLRAQLDFDGTREGMAQSISFFPYDASIITDALIDSRLEAATRPGALEAFRKLMPAPQGPERPIVRGIPLTSLATLDHPALILHGREDRVVPFDRAIDMHSALKNSQLHSFGHCGHWVQIERRSEFLHLVSHFMRQS
ncbi:MULTISPECIES: alpha/beta hydrolase [unclassified Beijerinckia]|uniref:alpha/beta fold hydrolase n=1 Tax=unclassified Beijerinckia TaxID=2638183 RepID=UPI00089A8D5B|nr:MULTISPECIES: alpha/beta hydrolase [unclassified Beijerinckia]MDH7799045.1 2-hydroxy-6-oxo-octa-2,4-dienoate hydrolase [Beijerinckia sp. GAS462]SED96836.1 2-hydroxymuconate semialdehyde hydrolase [Beijerinckia sp. 28-YEA-48]